MQAVRFFKNAREYLTPVLQESAFIEKGMLTPEEVSSIDVTFAESFGIVLYDIVL